MEKKPKCIIRCPKCDREYLPEEIFVPTGFFGNPSYIEKDYLGKIIDYSGNSIDTCEEYICDNCNTKFKIYAKLSVRTEINNLSNYIEDTTIPLTPQIELSED